MADKEVVITYETLYELLRIEKLRPELQKLDESFFKDIVNYIQEKKAILDSQKAKDSVFTQIEAEKTKRQIVNILKIVRDLYEKRENKILQLALIASRTGQENKVPVMLTEEKELYKLILDSLSKFRQNILHNILEAKTPEIIEKEKPKEIKTLQKPENSTKLIRFLHELPKFVGTDLKTYGPFDKEDVAHLPTEVANLLIKKEKAEEIK